METPFYEKVIREIDENIEKPLVTAKFGDMWRAYAIDHIPYEDLVTIAWKQGRRAILLERALEKFYTAKGSAEFKLPQYDPHLKIGLSASDHKKTLLKDDEKQPVKGSAEDFIKAKYPQDYDDIPQWHIDDLKEFAAQQRELPLEELLREAFMAGYDLASECDCGRCDYCLSTNQKAPCFDEWLKSKIQKR